MAESTQWQPLLVIVGLLGCPVPPVLKVSERSYFLIFFVTQLYPSRLSSSKPWPPCPAPRMLPTLHGRTLSTPSLWLQFQCRQVFKQLQMDLNLT